MANVFQGGEIPTGLGMLLAQSPAALDTYKRMSEQQRMQLVNSLQGEPTGDAARAHMLSVVQQLENGNAFF